MTATKIAGEQYRRELAHSASSGDLRRGRGGCHDQNPARLSSVCLLGRVGHGDRARGSEPAHLRGWDLHQGASCNVTCQIFPPTSRHLPASIPDLIRWGSIKPIDSNGPGIHGQGRRDGGWVKVAASRNGHPKRFARPQNRRMLGAVLIPSFLS